MKNSRSLWSVSFALFAAVARALDGNGNQQSDIWEMVHGAPGLTAAGDADGDGFSNASESLAGTNPLNPQSRPRLDITSAGLSLQLAWPAQAGKRYTLFETQNFVTWTPAGMFDASANVTLGTNVATGVAGRFFRVSATDFDTDGDTLSDYEERLIGFDPTRANTERFSTADATRAAAGLTAANTISVAVYDELTSEHWAEPAVFAVRRTGGLQPLTVNVQFTGNATRGVDYTTMSGNTVSFPAGVREVFVEVSPLADADDMEPSETVTLAALPGSGYSVGAQDAASATILNATATTSPTAKEAARFLIQAAFGPDQDSTSDGDDVPENVETVQALGFEAWITDQFTRPVGLIRPFVQWEITNGNAMGIYGDYKQHAWWNRAMGVPKLRPDDTATQLPDPLRQRVAFALSEIFVISDRPEQLATEPDGMAHYYDMILGRSFGNFRDLLYDVSIHPCMGIYLSHLGNRKANPAEKIYPDENYARENMQLFTIGLWQLNPDGTRQLNAQGQPIPTYDNGNITEFARVFTGLSHGNNAQFNGYSDDFTVPMKGFDAEHDLAPKTLLNGVTTPARTASAGNTGTATLADVNAAVDCLFNHPNTGPFIATKLIQRLVTSNPAPAYVGRVAAAFANNGSGVRGDMKSVVRAILLDPEARSFSASQSPTFGKLREPFLRCVNFATAFNATAASGFYQLDSFILDHAQEPLKSPSVFNFFLPTYMPPGTLTQQGVVAPEFQIINATTTHTGPNYFWNATLGGLHRWGTGNASREVKLNLVPELTMSLPAGTNIALDVPNVTATDPDALIRRLDLALTGGALSPQQYQIIREAMNRITAPTWQWHRERLRVAVWLIVNSAEFNVLR